MIKYILPLSVLALSCDNTTFSHETVEQSRMQAKENALQNAQKYLSENKHFSKLDIYSRGDSTINTKCPQGDGWASIDLVNSAGVKMQGIKCSTTSLALNCMKSEEFKQKSFYSQENKCNKDIPHPLPKLTN